MTRTDAAPRISPESEAETLATFGTDGLWIGRHDADHDLLVFDPAESDPSAPLLSLYSLTQHRARSFTRSTVAARIHPLTDVSDRTRAEEDYARRALLREEVLSGERAARMNRVRDGVIAAHRRFMQAMGLDYAGVRDTAPGHKNGRRTKCHACRIALDDFAGTVCVTCDGVLCSCGACACGRAAPGS